MIRLSAFSFWLLLAALAGVFAATLVFGGPESWWDRELLYAAQIGVLAPAARVATEFGAWWAVLLIGGAGAAWLAWRRDRRRDALLLAGLLVSERLVVGGLKLIFDRARPDPAGHLVAVHTMAFPSGHSANAMALGLAMALLLPEPGRPRGPAIAAGLLFALIVGLSRPVLGVHWPSDVVGGWAIGALWTLLLVRLAAGTSPPHPH
jgi:undecaprenyl-diphosphatase